MASHQWTCRGCGTRWPRIKQRCDCGRARPAPRKPAHRAALEAPYEEWVERFGGEVCGICGRSPSARRRLDRDHCHGTGEPRGLLCARCNRALPSFVTVSWLEAAADYLRRTSRDES